MLESFLDPASAKLPQSCTSNFLHMSRLLELSPRNGLGKVSYTVSQMKPLLRQLDGVL